ncbi:MAG: hypothetical protein FD121_1691, partial [Gallionellaceae bacterium]
MILPFSMTGATVARDALGIGLGDEHGPIGQLHFFLRHECVLVLHDAPPYIRNRMTDTYSSPANATTSDFESSHCATQIGRDLLHPFHCRHGTLHDRVALLRHTRDTFDVARDLLRRITLRIDRARYLFQPLIHAAHRFIGLYEDCGDVAHVVLTGLQRSH